MDGAFGAFSKLNFANISFNNCSVTFAKARKTIRFSKKKLKNM